MEDLIDIQGLDYIGWWPLSLTWWLIIAVACGGLGLAVYILIRKLQYRSSWQYRAHAKLAAMHSQIGVVAHKDILQKLSMEMRKIAMLSSNRENCAGLIGNKWLQWLQEHDPAGFDWLQNGALLISAQYMPDAVTADAVIAYPVQISQLITAAQGWVAKC